MTIRFIPTEQVFAVKQALDQVVKAGVVEQYEEDKLSDILTYFYSKAYAHAEKYKTGNFGGYFPTLDETNEFIKESKTNGKNWVTFKEALTKHQEEVKKKAEEEAKKKAEKLKEEADKKAKEEANKLLKEEFENASEERKIEIAKLLDMEIVDNKLVAKTSKPVAKEKPAKKEEEPKLCDSCKDLVADGDEAEEDCEDCKLLDKPSKKVKKETKKNAIENVVPVVEEAKVITEEKVLTKQEKLALLLSKRKG